ncbi:hypothetical protein ABIF50_010148 [Bradyrhizobium diazoefficiens]
MVSTSFMVDTSSHPRAQLHRCVERSAYSYFGRGAFLMRKLVIAALCAALGGCAAAPKMGWVRVDGQSSREIPFYKRSSRWTGPLVLASATRLPFRGSLSLAVDWREL